jgi:uncharacterized cupredoxin-like copper-binding protein
MLQRFSSRMLVGTGIIALALAGCGPAGSSAAPPTPGGETMGAEPTTPEMSEPAGSGSASGAVNVTLQEWAVVPAAMSATAGDVTFHVTNTGPEDEHELVVIRTDLDPGALPTKVDGSVDESGAGIEVVDEVEELAVGSSADLTVNLPAGKYVLICNIYDETEKEAHYQQGMRTGFEVQ